MDALTGAIIGPAVIGTAQCIAQHFAQGELDAAVNAKVLPRVKLSRCLPDDQIFAEQAHAQERLSRQLRHAGDWVPIMEENGFVDQGKLLWWWQTPP